MLTLLARMSKYGWFDSDSYDSVGDTGMRLLQVAPRAGWQDGNIAAHGSAAWVSRDDRSLAARQEGSLEALLRGLAILTRLVEVMSEFKPMRSLQRHRQISNAFRDGQLGRIYRAALDLQRKLLHCTPQPAACLRVGCRG